MRKLLFLALMLLLATFCIAQSETATVSGRVTDSSGAIIRNAKVVMTSTATNVTATTKTDKDGFYVFTGVKPGRYRIAAGADGFSVLVKSDLVLHVQDEVSENFTLKVGSEAQTITVAADAVRVSTSPAVATTIDSNFVSRMPLNGRTIQNLIALTPGALSFAPTGSNAESNNDGQLSFNGLRESSNYMTIDGVSANIQTSIQNSTLGETNGLVPGFSLLGTTTNLVSADDLQEFKVQTSNYSAEFGRQPGGQIQLTTKSGTNQWHGSAYEYLRNDAFDARNFFDAPPLKKPALRLNDFGGTLGGPLWKDHTFFFFSYEGDRILLPQTETNVPVPSMQERQTAAAALQPFLNAFPKPTGPDNANGLTAPWSGAFSNPQTEDAESLRIDHNLNSRITLFARYNFSPQDTLQQGTGFSTKEHGTTTTLTGGTDVTFGPSVANQFRFNWSRAYFHYTHPFVSIDGSTAPSLGALFPPPFTPDSAGIIDFPGGVSSLGIDEPGDRAERHQLNLTDNVSWLRGNHLFKFGVDYRGNNVVESVFNTELVYLFSSLSAVQSGVANLSIVFANLVPEEKYSYRSLGAFAQDTWKVTSRLTLDYGLRWDVNTPPDFSPAPRFVSIDFVHPAKLLPAGTPLYPTIWTGFAPRFGAAYMLSNRQGHELVLRGGLGLFYDPGSVPPSGGPYFPNNAESILFNVPFPLTSVTIPTANPNPPYGSSNGTFQVAPESGFTLPRVYQWNVAMERAFGPNQKLTVTYVGNAGRRLLRGASLDPISLMYPVASPDFSPNATFDIFTNAPGHADSSNYNAMQVQFYRRTKSLSAILNYTWSHAIDTNSAPIFGNPLISFQNYSPNMDRGSSDFDRRQVFSGAVTWDVPSFHANGGFSNLAHAITNGWQLDSIVQVQTAAPVNVTYYDYSGTDQYNYSALRPDVVPGVPQWISSPGAGGGKVINPAAFSVPSTPRQGNLGRNALRGFGLFQPDIAIGRTIPITERVRLDLRAEAYNFLNHPNFDGPSNYIGFRESPTFFYKNANFGKTFATMNNDFYSQPPSGNGLSSLFQIGGPRSIQLSLRLSF